MNDLKEIGGFIVSADPYVNHDNSLSGNGTLTSPLGVVPGYNETVLWSGSVFTPAAGNNPMRASAALNESIENFDQIRLDFSGGYYFAESVLLTYPYKIGGTCYVNVKHEQDNNSIFIGTLYKWIDNTTLSGTCCFGNNTQNVTAMGGGYFSYGGVSRVVGINRKVQ